MMTAQDDRPWDACPPGEIRRMADRLHARRRGERLKKFGRSAAVAVAAVALLLVGRTYLVSSSPVPYGGIHCRDVVASLEGYRAGTIDAPLAEQIDAHLQQCPHCREQYRRMMGGTRETAALDAPRRRPLAATFLFAGQPVGFFSFCQFELNCDRTAPYAHRQ